MDPWILPDSIVVVWLLVLTGLIFYQGLAGSDGRKERSRRAKRLLLGLVLGLVLVAIPTAFAVFPHWSTWRLGLRILVVGAWLDAAAWAAYLTATFNEEDRFNDLERAERAERRAAIADQFRSILVPGAGGLPDEYHFVVYAPPTNGFLVPAYPRVLNFRDPAIFPIGDGATGQAWSDNQDIIARAEQVSNADFRLTAPQQRRFAMYGSVAATIIRNAEDDRLGVLTAIGRNDDNVFGTDKGLEALHGLANAIAWLMPEAVKWMLPTAEEGET